MTGDARGENLRPSGATTSTTWSPAPTAVVRFTVNGSDTTVLGGKLDRGHFTAVHADRGGPFPFGGTEWSATCSSSASSTEIVAWVEYQTP